MVAARGWLARNASATTNPGTFEPIREPEREATYYYYAWSLAHAARALGRGHGLRLDELARELIRRRRPDGTWANRFTASKEDEPLVATSFAAGALGLCRLGLSPLLSSRSGGLIWTRLDGLGYDGPPARRPWNRRRGDREEAASMRAVNHALPFEDHVGPFRTGDDPRHRSESGRTCLLHHLVVAAEELALDGQLGAESVRYVLLAARLRDMASHPEWDGDQPAIAVGSGSPQTLVGLLAEAWCGRRRRFPVQGIDPELLDAAGELLRGLAWEVPAGLG